MSRACRWPDGGCGAAVEFLPTGKLKVDGAKAMQVVNATPERRTVLVHEGGVVCTCRPEARGPQQHITVQVLTWRDHHADCEKWKAKVARERAARASR